MRNPLDPQLTLGAVNLTVTDLSRSVDYYTEQIGLHVIDQQGDRSTLGAGNTPLLHLLGDAKRPVQPHATGLYHFALLLPTRTALAAALKHYMQGGAGLAGASDHHVSEALYLTDPDGHGIEVYWDRPRAGWMVNGRLRLVTERLDIESILAERDDQPWQGLPDGTVMGHVHLQVADVPAAQRFYEEALGMDLMVGFSSALFMSAGGYHHHLGANVWSSMNGGPAGDDAARLLSYTLVLSDQAALENFHANLQAAGIQFEAQDGVTHFFDPAAGVDVIAKIA